MLIILQLLAHKFDQCRAYQQPHEDVDIDVRGQDGHRFHHPGHERVRHWFQRQSAPLVLIFSREILELQDSERPS